MTRTRLRSESGGSFGLVELLLLAGAFIGPGFWVALQPKGFGTPGPEPASAGSRVGSAQERALPAVAPSVSVNIPSADGNVTFNETGLPGGTYWKVTVGGTAHNTTSTNLTVELPNGTYAYAVGAVARYLVSPEFGNLTVAGYNLTVELNFTGCTYAIGEAASQPSFGMLLGSSLSWNWTIINYGDCVERVFVLLPTLPTYPNETTPTVTVSPGFTSMPVGSDALIEVNVSMPNNPHNLAHGWSGFLIANLSGTCASGAICVDPGVAKRLTISAVEGYNATFLESGLSSGTAWSVTTSPATLASIGGRLTFRVPNGTYPYTATSTNGGKLSGYFAVNGSALTVAVPFCAASHCAVSFNETGLPPGTHWRVTNNGATRGSNSTSIAFPEVDGQYSYRIGNLSGFYTSLVTGSYSILGKSVVLAVSFLARALASVTVGPSVDLLTLNSSTHFTVVPACTGGTCPKGIAYAWSVTPSSLGKFNRTVGSTVLFTAGGLSESGKIFVNATYHGVVKRGFVSVLDEKPKGKTIVVGSAPYQSAYDSRKGEIFVPVTSTNSVSVISDATQAVIANIPVGSDPIGAVYDPLKHEIFVPNTNSGNVSVISDTNNTVVATIAVTGSPGLPAFDSALGEVFVPDELGSTVAVISDSSNTVVANLGVGRDPGSAVYDPGTGDLFVGNGGASTVSVISAATRNWVQTIGVGSSPVALAYDGGTGEIFVSDQFSDEVTVISDSSLTAIANVSVPFHPEGLAVDSALREVFVGAASGTNVTVISEVSESIISTIPAGLVPLMVTLDLAKGRLYVSDYGNNTVSSIDIGRVPAHTVVFNETGLSLLGGRTWCVTFDGATRCTSSRQLSFGQVANGTYSYAIGQVPNYRPSGSYSGSVVVTGSTFGGTSNTVSTHWSLVQYTVRFTETGMPTNTTWQVTFGGTTVGSTGKSIAFLTSNGSYTFTIWIPGDSYSVASTSPVTVTGADLFVSVKVA